MTVYHPIQNMRLRVDDDGSAHIEFVVPTEGGMADVVATWQVDYLPDDVQKRLRDTLDVPGLSVAADPPGEARRVGGRPPGAGK